MSKHKSDPNRITLGRDMVDYAVDHGATVSRYHGDHAILHDEHGNLITIPLKELCPGTKRSIIKTLMKLGMIVLALILVVLPVLHAIVEQAITSGVIAY